MTDCPEQRPVLKQAEPLVPWIPRFNHLDKPLRLKI
jgi:hypothetical protein